MKFKSIVFLLPFLLWGSISQAQTQTSWGGLHRVQQNQNVWIGGTPGQENSWNQFTNWSLNRVPDYTDHVLIPMQESRLMFNPVIDESVQPIAVLEIESGANLTISNNGTLTIDGQYTYNYGIILFGDILGAGNW